MASEQLEQALGMLKKMGETMAKAKDLNEVRALLPETQLPTGVKSTAAEAGGVSAEWHVAEGADPNKVILYVHGGGYVVGSIATHRDLTGRLSVATGASILTLNHRLAPEHPFPAAIDDAVAAYGWVLDQGISPSSVVVAGDSSGGGLALATLLATRERGLPLAAAGVCLSGWFDLEMKGASMTTLGGVDPVVQRKGLAMNAQMYLGDTHPRNPLASALFADLAGLPPLLLEVGGSETLLDDSQKLAERAGHAGVDVTLKVWDEMPHVWPMFASFLPEGQQALDEIGDFVRGRVV